MFATTHRAYEPTRPKSAIEGCDHDLIHDLSRRIDSLARYDQYIANAKGLPAVQEFWRGAERHERETIVRLKSLIKQHVQNDCLLFAWACEVNERI